MTKYKTNWKTLAAVAIVVIVLSIIFTLDDATVIGEFLDPLEFAFTGAVGYLMARYMK